MKDNAPASPGRRRFIEGLLKTGAGLTLSSALGGCGPAFETQEPVQFHYNAQDCVMTPVKGMHATDVANLMFKAGYKLLLVEDSGHSFLGNAEMLSNIIHGAEPTDFFVEQIHSLSDESQMAATHNDFEAHRSDSFPSYVYPDVIAYAPDKSEPQLRQRYFNARRGVLFAARDKNAHITTFDLPDDTERSISHHDNAALAHNRRAVASLATNMELTLRDYSSSKEVGADDIKQLAQLMLGAGFFDYNLAEYTFPRRGIATGEDINNALTTMDDAEFKRLKIGLHTLLKNIYNQDVSKLSQEQLQALYEKREKELASESLKSDEERDAPRDEYMATQIANAAKNNPSIRGISFLGMGHFEHQEGTAERKIFPELVQEKLPNTKIAKINIIPILQADGDNDIENKLHTRVFLGGVGGADITIFCGDPIQGYNVTWDLKAKPEMPRTQKMLFDELKNPGANISR